MMRTIASLMLRSKNSGIQDIFRLSRTIGIISMVALLAGYFVINPIFGNLYYAASAKLLGDFDQVLFMTWFSPCLVLFTIGIFYWVTDPKCEFRKDRRHSLAALVAILLFSFCYLYYFSANEVDLVRLYTDTNVSVKNPHE